MRKAILLISAAVFLAGALPAFAQTERFSEAEYNAALAKALKAASSRDRRVRTEEKYYSGSQVTGTRKIISEFVGPDAKRIEVSGEFNGKRTVNDAIRIGDQFFCREGEKNWKRSDKDCSKDSMLAIPAGNYEYFVEVDPRNASRKAYIRRATYLDAGVPERDAARLKFIEIKFITDESGAITEYTETRRGGSKDASWSSTQVTTYEYEPQNLRIADPTSGN